MFEIGRSAETNEMGEIKLDVHGYQEIKPESDITIEEALDYLDSLFGSENLTGAENVLENHQDLTYKEKTEVQDKEISDVENGNKDFDRNNTHETGNYGEMKTDQDLRLKGYERISNDMVTDIDQNGHQGIDGVYYNPDGKPQYLIVDAKYGSAQLNPDTKDGKQMSENWIDRRLDKDVGKEKADDIRMEKLLNPDNVGCYVAHVDKDGNVTYDKLDSDANVIERDVKINE